MGGGGGGGGGGGIVATAENNCAFACYSCFMYLFLQLKAFARVQGKPETWDEKDKIFIAQVYTYDRNLTEHLVYRGSHIEEELLLTAFSLITVLIGLVLAWLVKQYYVKVWKELKVNNQDSDRNQIQTSNGSNVNGQGNRKSAEQTESDDSTVSGQGNSESAKHTGSGDSTVSGQGNSESAKHTESDDSTVNGQGNSESAKQIDSNSSNVNNCEQNRQVRRSLYWSTAFVFCCFDICSIGVFIIAHLFKHPILTTTDHVVRSAYITKMVIMLILYSLHLGVAIFAVRRNCSSSEEPQYKVLQVLALFSILIFFQTIGAAVIPLFILLVLYTFKVLSVIAFMCSSTFCFIFLIALLLKSSTAGEGRKGMLVTLLQACIIAVFLAVIGVLVAFYLILLSRGVDTKGLQGFLLSLLPSLALGVAGWYIKKVVLKEKKHKKTKRQIECCHYCWP